MGGQAGMGEVLAVCVRLCVRALGIDELFIAKSADALFDMCGSRGGEPGTGTAERPARRAGTPPTRRLTVVR